MEKINLNLRLIQQKENKLLTMKDKPMTIKTERISL